MPVLENNTTQEGFFVTNLESVQKDVECNFGILKKRWKVLNHGSKHCNIVKCKQFCITCYVLHNFLLDLMVRNHVRAGHGYSIGNNGLWLSGHTVNADNYHGVSSPNSVHWVDPCTKDFCLMQFLRCVTHET